MDLFGKSPRPIVNDEILDELAQVIAKEVYEWLNDDSELLEDVVGDVRDILEYSSNDDGYELAKRLEKKGYQSDAELVSTLDMTWHTKHELLDKKIRQWVISDKITPLIKINEDVLVKRHNKWVEGIIVGIKEGIAQYEVCIPSEGHTIGGSTKGIVNYENTKIDYDCKVKY